ncbi:hypothetical protein KI387_017059, partial [Taxus chinensis]
RMMKISMKKGVVETELISGYQNGNIRVWDLTANSCSCELVPDVDAVVRSLTVMWDGSLVVAANNHGTCYVWRLLRGTQNFQNLNNELIPGPSFPAASPDTTAKLWDLSKGEATVCCALHDAPEASQC